MSVMLEQAEQDYDCQLRDWPSAELARTDGQLHSPRAIYPIMPAKNPARNQLSRVMCTEYLGLTHC
jgi:hypothetical protein